MGKALYYGSASTVHNTVGIGLIIFILFMAISFMGYVLVSASMSYWATIVICNLLSIIPNFVEYIYGGFIPNIATINRFFVLHFILPFVGYGFILSHLFYLHYIGSNTTLSYSTNNMVCFSPTIIFKDLYGILFIFVGTVVVSYFNLFTLCHPDNSIEINELVTPLHIVPEWYFLFFYAILKSIPNKYTGLLILCCSIFLLLADINVIFIGLSFILLTYVGAQLPNAIIVYVARVFIILSTIIMFN